MPDGPEAPEFARRIFEEERYRNIQNARNVLKTARADPVGSFFILLDLLEGDPEALSELFLAHAQHGAAKANPATDMNVDGVRFLLVLYHNGFLISELQLPHNLATYRELTTHVTLCCRAETL